MLVAFCQDGKFFVRNGKEVVAGPFEDQVGAQRYSRSSRPQRRRLRKRSYIEKAKTKCQDCNSTDHLTFDHVRGKKEFNIGDGARHGWDRLKKEIAKCEVVCRSCHNVREYLRGVVCRLVAIEDLSTLLLKVAPDAL